MWDVAYEDHINKDKEEVAYCQIHVDAQVSETYGILKNNPKKLSALID